jgi:fructokinase
MSPSPSNQNPVPTHPVPVIVIGEALVDVVRPADADADVASEEHPGGSPMNVAVGLSRLGDPTTLVCALGDDPRGASIREHVEASGVQLHATTIDRTSTAIASIAADGSASYEFDLDWSIDPVVLPEGTPVVHVGSIATVLQPGASVIAEVAANRPEGTLLTVDPNVRPTITGDRDEVIAAVEPLMAAADVVKMSDEDAAWLYPGDSVDAVLDRVLRLGATIAAVTLGGDGCVIAGADVRMTVTAPRVDVADTIGAGDSFMAGLVHAVLQDRSVLETPDQDALERLASFAISCAAITVSRPGANPPTLAEVA